MARGVVEARRGSLMKASAPRSPAAHASLPALACLLYVMIWPVSNPQVLYPALALLAGCGAIDLIRSPRLPARPFFAAYYLLWVAGLLALFVGSLRNTPGLQHQGILWVGGLLAWGVWGCAVRVESVRRILTAITVGAIILSLIVLLYVGAQSGILPNLLPEFLLAEQGAFYDGSDESIAIRLYGLSTLTIVGPALAAGAIVGSDDLMPSRRLLVLAAALVVLAALLSGRRGVAVVTVLAPVLILLIRVLYDIPRKPLPWGRIVWWAAGTGPVWSVLLWWASGTTAWRQGLGSLQDAAAVFLGLGDGALRDEVRLQQAEELVEGWSAHPVFGAGLGARLESGFTRSIERPWAFELQYHQWLYNAGLVGVALALGVVLAVLAGMQTVIRRSPQHAPVLTMVSVGALGLLLANASNPYLQAVGHWWGIVLPLAVGNALLLAPQRAD